MMRIHKKQHGFTIVELMIATAVFSIVLLICSFAIIHIGKMYYKGVITNRTQDTSRRLIEDVSSSIQFGATSEDPDLFRRTGAATYSGVNVESLCIGSVRYSYSRNHFVGQIRHVLWRDDVTTNQCTPRNITLNTPSSNGQELLGSNMRLPQGITANPVGQLWQVSLLVSYGDNADLFTNSSLNVCRGVSAGGQFCAVSGFTTSVMKRL
ncbi:MAG: prepilin-type N-terminal cleavage/methylation domain-containing protein [bacterium]|nr:prepilin-type N-terminal cleavage/methylation domain-containing protein [bacterium]